MGDDGIISLAAVRRYKRQQARLAATGGATYSVGPYRQGGVYLDLHTTDGTRTFDFTARGAVALAKRLIRDATRSKVLAAKEKKRA